MYQKYGIFHKTFSPHHPQSNGFAESMVKITKKILAKAQDSKEDPYFTMCNYKATHISTDFQVLMSWWPIEFPECKLQAFNLHTLLSNTSSILRKEGKYRKNIITSMQLPFSATFQRSSSLDSVTRWKVMDTRVDNFNSWGT